MRKRLDSSSSEKKSIVDGKMGWVVSGGLAVQRNWIPAYSFYLIHNSQQKGRDDGPAPYFRNNPIAESRLYYLTSIAAGILCQRKSLGKKIMKAV